MRLLSEFGAAHPCLLTVMMNAVDQYLTDAATVTASADFSDGAEVGSGEVPGFVVDGFGTGLAAQRWREEFLRLGADLSGGEPAEVTEWYRVRLERMHVLLPNGKPYPAHAEAYVISPEMHNVVRAAALTVTREDLLTVDPDTDLPTPAGLLLLPVACRSGFGAYPALSAVGWRPETGHVLPDGPRRSGIWVEGMSQRRDLDQLPMWAYIVAASRDAGAKPPLAVPFSHEWLLPGRVLDDDERAALARLDRLNDLIYERKEAQVAGSAESAEYDPARDADAQFSLAAYAFAFWRLCRQPITVTAYLDGRPPGPRDRRAGGTGSAETEPGPVDRVRVVQLRTSHTPPAPGDRAGEGQAGAGGPRYHHRFPVRMHKVRQYYPSTGEHKVIWRGPYIKGPDGAPLLIGPKAHALTQ